MLKTKHEKKPRDYDIHATQEIIIAKPLTDMPIFVSNVPANLSEKTQVAPKRTTP